MPKVTVANEKREIEVQSGANLRAEAQKAGVDLYPGLARYLNCRGLGACGTCRVLVKQGVENVSPMGWIEWFNLNLHPHTSLAVVGHENQMRLACQCKINGDCTIEAQPEFNWSGENFWQKPYPNK